MNNSRQADLLGIPSLPERAFRFFSGRTIRPQGGGKGSAPAPVDYAGAAQATAAGNLEAARAASSANRVNQYTPYGNLEYSHSGDNPDGGWSATQTLSPQEQAKLDQTNNLTLGLLGTAGQGLGYVNQSLGTGGKLDESKLAQMPIQGQSVQDAIMARLQPQIDQNRDALATKLSNQGLAPGSEAYRRAMVQQGQNENDLYTQAALQGINTGLTARQQGIQEQYTTQDRPLNIVNALRTGAQVQAPQFVNVPQQATTSGPDLLGAAMAQGQQNMQNATNSSNAKNAFGGSLLGAAGKIGAAYLM